MSVSGIVGCVGFMGLSETVRDEEEELEAAFLGSGRVG